MALTLQLFETLEDLQAELEYRNCFVWTAELSESAILHLAMDAQDAGVMTETQLDDFLADLDY